MKNNLPIPRFDDYLVMKLLINYDNDFIIEKLEANIDKFKSRKYLTLEYIAKALGVKLDNHKFKVICEDIIIK